MPKNKTGSKTDKTGENEDTRVLLPRKCAICYEGEYPDYPIIEKLFFKKGRITQRDIKKLSSEEKTALNYAASEKLNSLRGKARDEFIDKIYNVVNDDTRANFWNYLHIDITGAISNAVQENNRMPSVIEIAGRTGYSRAAIVKHLTDYKQFDNYNQQAELFKILGDKILSKVAKFAIQGDMKAARLYFEVLNGAISKAPVSNNNTFNTQNNLLINGQMVSQADILSLPPEQQAKLSEILHGIPQFKAPARLG